MLASEHPRDGSRLDAEESRLAEAVRGFYERHPYPRPVTDLERYRERWDKTRRRVEHHRFWPECPFRPLRSVLVAGCGTSQAARYALREPEARVVGIDVSESSLEGTHALKERYGLGNLELFPLRLEDVARLERRFDLVVCTGVLHHLPSPERGLRALAEVLAPGGAMLLMVYAPYGRAGIYLIQRYAKLLGLGTSTAEIRQLAATLAELPPAHPLRHVLENSPDFQTEGGLADALLNPMDRPYSVPDLFHLIETGGLRFGRWLRQAPYRAKCGAPLLTPHGERLAELPEPEQFAAMELFRGTMTRHSAVLRHEKDVDAHALDFSSDRCLRYVPLRVQDTVCVEEGIPASSAGVLINPNHIDTDLYLPIDKAQKALFEAIDGARSLGELAGRDVEAARTFFERLWHYDQVVFDTSQAPDQLERS